MSTGQIAAAHDRLIEAVEHLRAVVVGAGDTEQINVLIACEAARRRLDHLSVGVLAGAERRDVFTSRGYKTSTAALADLLGLERHEARRHVMAAENVVGKTALDGTALPPRLPATSEVFDSGRTSLRHVEVIAKVLGTRAAERLAPEVWSAAEAEIAAKAPDYTPTELQAWGTELVDKLDQDGPEPDDRPEPEVNELRLVRHRNRPDGKITGRFDDAAMFDTIATVIDAKSKPTSSDETREPAQRQAEALADVCGYALSHAPHGAGPRDRWAAPADLGHRAARRPRSPCPVRDARLRRTHLTRDPAHAGLRRRDHPHRDERQGPTPRRRARHPHHPRRPAPRRHRPRPRMRPPRLRPAALLGGDPPHPPLGRTTRRTKIENLVMLCKQHHRLIHHSGWTVRIRDGLPEFLPPAWIDPERTPRRQPGPVIDVPAPRRPEPPAPAASTGTGVRIANMDDLFGAHTR